MGSNDKMSDYRAACALDDCSVSPPRLSPRPLPAMAAYSPHRPANGRTRPLDGLLRTEEDRMTPLGTDREAVPDMHNRLGLNGIEFIEYATTRPQALGHVLGAMGCKSLARGHAVPPGQHEPDRQRAQRGRALQCPGG